MDADLRTELATVEDRHWWFEGRRRILERVLVSIGPEPGARLLEAGCGNGANLAVLARFGEVSAFEPFDTDRQRARRRGIGRVEPGSLPDRLPFQGERFDVVLALDVVEHVRDDVAALAALANRTTERGHVVVTVPAHPFLWSRHDVRNGHFRRYTRRSLRAALERAGLRVSWISHFNTLLLAPVAVARTAGRLVGADGAGTGLPPALLNRALTSTLAAERHLVGRVSVPLGVSLLAVASPS